MYFGATLRFATFFFGLAALRPIALQIRDAAGQLEVGAVWAVVLADLRGPAGWIYLLTDSGKLIRIER